MERDRGLEIKVGMFVALALAGFVAMVIVLGSEDALFEERYTLQGKFSDVNGLRVGAAVFLAGMDCGLVSDVNFPNQLSDQTVHVTLSIRQACRERIRGDSIASISSQGLLGDKLVTITVGSEDRNAMEEGSWLETIEPAELTDFLDDGRDILVTVKSIVEKIDTALGSDDGQGAGKSVLAILQSVRDILAEVEDGNGIIHALVYDKQITNRLTGTLVSIDKVADDFAAVAAEIKDGDGLVHNLVYEDEITPKLVSLVENLNGTGQRIDDLVKEIQEGEGLIHDLVYTDEGQSMLADLKDVSADIKDIVAATKRGEGTIGGLLVDPTIYHDVKTLLGQAQRNKILKAYVRDTLRRNEQQEGVSDAGLTE
ncbi:MAG: MCE family protein [Deltaproteobacteria bacterium]|nr:MCE family protein [Deltaproteobacteria bacterium]